MTVDRAEERILILGGGGMVGLQVAREAARELQPSLIVLSALTQQEVDAAIAILEPETKGIELAGVSGHFHSGVAAGKEPRGADRESRMVR